jgi:hypothetical protein
MLELVPLALASAVDPVLIAAVAVMLSRGSPANLLVAYLVGGAGVSVGAGVLVLLVLGTVGVGLGSSGGESSGVDMAAGGVLLAVAIVAATGLDRRVVASAKVRGRDGSHSGPGQGKRSLLDRVRSVESPWVAWLAGVAWGVPGAFYLAALALIARSGAATTEAVAAIVVFNLVMFALVEVPLVAFLVAPDPTRAMVQRFSNWMSAHRRAIVADSAGAVGLYLLVKTLGVF